MAGGPGCETTGLSSGVPAGPDEGPAKSKARDLEVFFLLQAVVDVHPERRRALRALDVGFLEVAALYYVAGDTPPIMKAILASLLLLCVFLKAWSEGPPQSQQVHEILKGGSHRSLVTIGEGGPIRPGARIVFKTSHTAAGIVREYDSNFSFEDGEICPGVRVYWNGGEAVWVKRKELRKAYLAD